MARDTAAVGTDVVVGSNSPDVETTVEALIRAYNRLPLNTNLTGGDTVTWDATNGVWVPGSGPSFELIAEQELAAAAASVVFSSIPATYQHLRIAVLGRGDVAGTSAEVHLRFNGDTTANYDWQQTRGAGTGASAGSAMGQTSMKLGNLAAAGAVAGYTGLSAIDILGYAQTTLAKSAIGVGGHTRDTTTIVQDTNYGFWRSAAAINQLTVFPSAGNFVAGSIFTLYGIKGAA